MLRPHAIDRSRALNASADISQFLQVTTGGQTSSGQERSQVCQRHQVALDLQNQAPELVAICRGHAARVPVLISVPLYKTSHWELPADRSSRGSGAGRTLAPKSVDRASGVSRDAWLSDFGILFDMLVVRHCGR
jgi:hypothetical protein